MRWEYTINDIIAKNWNTVLDLNLNTHQIRHLHNISKCHTAHLGGTMTKCQSCNHLQYKYHSCRNRHCPSCQGSKREEWIQRQQKYLLDVPYFHVVFTLPSELRSLCLHKPKLLYSLLFKASWETIDTLSKDTKYLGAQTGMTCILHTWSQNLSLHPHLHCIVPGGGLSKNGNWVTTRTKGKYLFPANVIATLFRAIFMKGLKKLAKSGKVVLEHAVKEALYAKKWVVYAKRPFAKPAHVIEYLGRYTHKIAISNYRIIKVTDTHVHFKWKDYRHGAKSKTMVLSVAEFIRRIAMHILPHRFVRIRHYGLLSFHGRSKKIPALQKEQGFIPQVHSVVQRVPQIQAKCEKCGSEQIIEIEVTRLNIRSP